jgi:hypothetical protein
MGRKLGTRVKYTPQETGRYRSQWLRLKKAQTRQVTAITNELFHVESKRSTTGYWEVTYKSSGATTPSTGGNSAPGPGTCAGSIYQPPAGQSAIAVYAYHYDQFEEDPAARTKPGLATGYGFGYNCSGHTRTAPPGAYFWYGQDLRDHETIYAYSREWTDEPDLYINIWRYAYSAGENPNPPTSDDEPFVLIDNYSGSQTLVCEPNNTDRDRGYCYPSSGGGSGGVVGGNPAPKTFSCNCPDYSRKEAPTGRFNSEEVSRDWSSSNAGSGNVAGVQQPCLHILAVKQFLGLPIYAKPGDWREMVNWKNYVRSQASDRARRRLRRKQREEQRQRIALRGYKRWLYRVGNMGNYSKSQLKKRSERRARRQKRQAEKRKKYMQLAKRNQAKLQKHAVLKKQQAAAIRTGVEYDNLSFFDKLKRDLTLKFRNYGNSYEG